MLRLSAGACAGGFLAERALAQDGDPGDWSGDVTVLGAAWTALHAGLYRYTTQEALTAGLAALAQAWAAPSNFRTRLLALTRVTASLRCSHTYPSPHNSPDDTVAKMYPDRSLVPFRFRWIAGRMVITHDDGPAPLFPQGTVVTAINGVDTGRLLDELITLARADGSNDVKRINLMEVRGSEQYEALDIHLPLILPLRDTGVFTLSTGQDVEARLLTREERDARRESTPSMVASEDNPWRLERRSDGIAVLTMPTWALYDTAFPWETWLEDTMDDLASEARGLVVDLRGNEGGQDCGNVILSRLLERPLALSRDQNWTRYRRVPDELRPFLTTWDPSFYDWGDQATPSAERPGYFRLERDGARGEPERLLPAGRRFAGPTVVLCDASNSSATFSFCQAVKESGAARLIGGTTGGNLRGLNGGGFFFLRLPSSRLVVDLPLIASFPARPQPDAAIEPDIPVGLTAEDILLGRDPVMAAAFQEIEAHI